MAYKTKDQPQDLPKHARKTRDAHGSTRKKSPTPERGAYHKDMNNVQPKKVK